MTARAAYFELLGRATSAVRELRRVDPYAPAQEIAEEVLRVAGITEDSRRYTIEAYSQRVEVGGLSASDADLPAGARIDVVEVRS